ncbi:MAG: hypothetical protein A2096_07060 [Spirochaetes bacterium GWF1_41_5]|nr:MAG: hypothetical protein A2096_07060 [Spirochaetes bacterium GWF1_41_5]HBE01829.1 hypothetical protein [Spirochaetia bacterium]
MKAQEFFEKQFSEGFFYSGRHKKNLKELFALIRVPEAPVILDIGFGEPSELIFLNETFAGSTVVGLDIYEKKMKGITHGLREFNRIRVFRGDINALEFEEEYFNAIFSFNSFYFSRSAESVLAAILGSLKRKGVFALELDFYSGHKSRNQAVYDKYNIEYNTCQADHLLENMKNLRFIDTGHYISSQGNLFIYGYKK